MPPVSMVSLSGTAHWMFDRGLTLAMASMIGEKGAAMIREDARAPGVD